jgi:hypothetical protein
METKSALIALSALGHESRLAAFRQLVQAGPDGLAVGELRERLALPPATLAPISTSYGRPDWFRTSAKAGSFACARTTGR